MLRKNTDVPLLQLHFRTRLDHFLRCLTFKLLEVPASRPTAGVTGAGVGVDSAWEQYKPEARKLHENAQTPTTMAPTLFVGDRLQAVLGGVFCKWHSCGL
jgi:hypothetical protein